MSTKMLRLPPRRVITPSSNKRNSPEEEDGRPDAVNPSASKKPKTEPVEAQVQAQLGSASNQLLAGYLAHEFLTRGTLFGQPWDSARADGSAPEPCAERLQRYVAVADLIGAEASHLPGVVNPAQLARLLQL